MVCEPQGGMMGGLADFGESYEFAACLACFIDEFDGFLHTGFKVEPLQMC